MSYLKVSSSSDVERFLNCEKLSIDTETSGLMVYKTDRAFCAVISDGKDVLFFERDKFELMRPLLLQKRLWFAHNFKFDLQALRKEGYEIMGLLHDTQVVARLIDDDEFKYDLKTCLERAKLPVSKGDMLEYCTKNGHYEKVSFPGKKSKETLYFFHKVPFDIMFEYACTDAIATYMLGEWQLKKLEEMDVTRRADCESIFRVYGMEQAITKILFEMESVGMRLDVEYTKKSLASEKVKLDRAILEFKEKTGENFVDSRKCLQPIFDRYLLKYGKTEKDNASFKNEFLVNQEHESIDLILQIRESSKLINSYYQTFLYYCDENGDIHANIRQSGTKTGRFSVTDPALQTLKKESGEDDEDELSDSAKTMVRRCFIPRAGFIFLFIDYKQQEYRVMLDYAQEMTLIEMVKNGMDVHEATAQIIEQTRKAAKEINFGLLYGIGKDKLAIKLKTTVDKAQEMKRGYFEKLPKVKNLIRGIIEKVENTKILYNRYGRVYILKDSRFAYKFPNKLIQGGCSDCTRQAMIDGSKVLEGKKSRLVMQVHDEIIYEIHKDEFDVIEELKRAAEGAFPYRYLPLEVDLEWSDTSWQDKKKIDLLSR